MIAPVWNQYCNSAKDDESLKHQEAYDLQDIISDLREWLGEYEAAHPKQPDTPTGTPSAKEDNLSYITNDKILKALPDLYDCLVDDGVVDANAISKADFKSKSFIALKEARESMYWIELLHRNGYLDDKQYASIHNINH